MIRQFILFSIIGLLLTGAACSPNKSTFKNNKEGEDSHLKDSKSINYNRPNDSDSLKNKVTMIIEPATIKASLVGKTKIIITNHSADTLKVGERFLIEFYNGVTWKRLTIFDDNLFNDIAFSIPPGAAKELPINLQPKPNNYKTGKYRICPVVQVMPNNRELSLTAEFFIQ
jgi:hypothetical protein